MQSKATTVEAYLASLPEDRRAAISAVRQVILKNLKGGYEEGMQYGMIGYFVPHSVYPAGYHCDPKQPLPFAGLASQKQHMSLYLMGLYLGSTDEAETPIVQWFKEAWTKGGRELDMGRACVRFRTLDDVPLDVVGEAIARMPVKTYLATYEPLIPPNRKPRGAPSASKASNVRASKKTRAARPKAEAKSRPSGSSSTAKKANKSGRR